MIPEIRQYQFDQVERLAVARGQGKRIIAVQGATGSGKTNVGCYITGRAYRKEAHVLWLVHLRKLVDQIGARLAQFEIPYGVIMRGEHPWGSAKVQVASRDTIMSRCFRHEWTGLPPADLIIVDEFHHAANPDSDYRKILAQYPKATILGLTATPVGPDGQGMGPWVEHLDCALPTSQLVAQGYLCPVKCYAPERKTGRGGKMKRGIAGDLVESWRQYGCDLPTVLFCSRVQHSLDAVQAYAEAGIPAAHVDADTPDEERDRIYDGISTGKIKIVSNVGIIREGVDIPCLGCVQFYMDPSGRVMFLQACGRIMRPFPGKKEGIVIDHAGAVHRHGFPDEDTTWTLEGNADADFKKKQEAGGTEKMQYCKACALMYHGQVHCPQCGKMPSKPPKSIFAPPPMETTSEILTEADRAQRSVEMSDEFRIKVWMASLGKAANTGEGKSFGMAAMIYKKKYGEFPKDHFPCIPRRDQWKMQVHVLYPKFRRKK